jgi:hypothetical protein
VSEKGERTVETWLVVSLVLSAVLPSRAAEPMRASELLDRYRDNQAKLQSFICRYTATYVETSRGKEEPYTSRETSEFRTDGNRVHILRHFWRNPAPGDETHPERAQFRTYLWDGKISIEYRTATGQPVSDYRAFVKTHDRIKKEMIATGYEGAALLGVLFFHAERVDLILRRAKSISVRPTAEPINGSKCYAIDAVTEHEGDYAVWIDPEHGYNIARAEKRIRPGDIVQNQSWTAGGARVLLDNVRFKDVAGVWVPVEGDREVARYDQNGQVYFLGKLHYAQTSIQLNPDHDALRSFVPQVQDGTTVFVEGINGVEHVWGNGTYTRR